jgi:muconolactone delta-isomerase
VSEDRYPSEKADRFMVRLPDGMRDRLKEAAKANNRTMNAEVVARLGAFEELVRENEDLRTGAVHQTAEIERLRVALRDLGLRNHSLEEASLPIGPVRDRLSEAAYRRKRSLQTEMLLRLEATLRQDDALFEEVRGRGPERRRIPITVRLEEDYFEALADCAVMAADSVLFRLQATRRSIARADDISSEELEGDLDKLYRMNLYNENSPRLLAEINEKAPSEKLERFRGELFKRLMGPLLPESAAVGLLEGNREADLIDDN